MPKQLTPKLVKAYADHTFAYEAFKPDGRLHIVCPQCRSLVLLFEDLSPAVKREIAELRVQNAAAAIRRLLQATRCELAQAKANVLHIRLAQSRCHWCRSAVPAGALLCASCFSVNLDW